MRSRFPLAACCVATLFGSPTATSPAGEPVFCYRTLADVACYLEPDHGREGRLVGVYRLRAPDRQEVRRGAGSR